MRAAAALAVERPAAGAPHARSRIRRLRSDPPIVLRPTFGSPRLTPTSSSGLIDATTIHIALVAGAASPVGGDDVHLDIDVGAGAALVLRAVAATIALPGPHGHRSRFDVNIRVAAGGTLIWLPGTLIAAARCRHHTTTTITLAPDARLHVRESLLLGRHDEAPGSLHQRLRVVRGEKALHDQELRVGPGAPGWTGPAVTGGRRAIGSTLLVDPALDTTATACSGDGWARMPLPGPAVLVTAAADDAATLERLLDAASITPAEPIASAPHVGATPVASVGVR